jgi:hypothetical protein
MTSGGICGGYESRRLLTVCHTRPHPGAIASRMEEGFGGRQRTRSGIIGGMSRRGPLTAADVKSIQAVETHVNRKK